MIITFLGNHGVSYSSETHHVKTLRSMGHEVIDLQEGRVTGETVLKHALKSDLLVIVHTHGWQTPGMPLDEVLRRIKGKVKTVTYHLDLWFGISRHKDIEADPFYKLIDHFFTVDKYMADWFNSNTEVKGHYLAAGVYDKECYIADPHPKSNDVIFVGAKGYHHEYEYRPKLIKWLRETYGDKFTHVGGDGDTGTVREHDLNRMYAGSKVVVGDTLSLNFDYPWYFSDRLFETTGRGGFLLFPYIYGISDYFEIGKELIVYHHGDFADLKSKIDYYLNHPNEREAIRWAGFTRTRDEHTYKNRWEEILEEVFCG